MNEQLDLTLTDSEQRILSSAWNDQYIRYGQPSIAYSMVVRELERIAEESRWSRPKALGEFASQAVELASAVAKQTSEYDQFRRYIVFALQHIYDLYPIGRTEEEVLQRVEPWSHVYEGHDTLLKCARAVYQVMEQLYAVSKHPRIVGVYMGLQQLLLETSEEILQQKSSEFSQADREAHIVKSKFAEYQTATQALQRYEQHASDILSINPREYSAVETIMLERAIQEGDIVRALQSILQEIRVGITHPSVALTVLSNLCKGLVNGIENRFAPRGSHVGFEELFQNDTATRDTIIRILHSFRFIALGKENVTIYSIQEASHHRD